VPDHVHTIDCIAIVLPTVYDGISLWDCHDGHLRNRWPRDDRRHRAAEETRRAILADRIRHRHYASAVAIPDDREEDIP
jgi:hypothetical protein